MPRKKSRQIVPLVVLTGILTLLAAVVAATGEARRSSAHLVEPAAIVKLLPAIDGWTKVDSGSSQIDIRSDCSYTFAAAEYSRAGVRVRLTIGDTGAHPDSLITLATLIMTLPDDHNGSVPPATTIKRSRIGEHQAAEIWNDAKAKGELSVLVNKRFVVLAESIQTTSLEPLREILAAVDLKAIAALGK